MLPVVAIVGKPNVGKSVLFNALIGKRKAIESKLAGTTRDRLYQKARLFDYEIWLVDTGGLEFEEKEDIEVDVQTQARLAILGADLIILVVDGRYDPTASDFGAASLLRKGGKPCILVANKCDSHELLSRIYNLFELGFEEVIAISALHKTGLDKLRQGISDHLAKMGFKPELIRKKMEKPEIRIAFLGRPNVGKSSLVNAILGEEKVLVREAPGTTRDAVEIPFTYQGTNYILVDTAGLRRRGKIQPGIEKFSILRCLQAIQECDVALLILDYQEGVAKQDCHISQAILDRKKGLILVVNKIDLKPKEEKEERFMALLREKFDYLPWVPVVFTSALFKKNLFRILEQAKLAYFERQKKILDQELQNWLENAVAKHILSGGKGRKRSQVLEVKQVGINPPSFVFFTRHPELIHFSYQRYLENELRKEYGFVGTALKLDFRAAK